MTPKNKALQIFESFYESNISTVPVTRNEAKELAIKCIDETISMLKIIGVNRHLDFVLEVKSELKKL